MAATLDDVAKRSGYSPATISRVVNDFEGVSPEVRTAVEKAIRELGYVSRRARMAERSERLVNVILHRRSTMERIETGPDGTRVGPVMPAGPAELLTQPWQLSNDFYRHILDGIVSELQTQGGKAVLQVITDLDNPVLRDALADGSQGVLLVGEGDPAMNGLLAACRSPLVLVDILLPGGGQEQVTTDNFDGIGQSVAHLVELGHRRLGFVSGTRTPPVIERVEAFAYHAFRHGVEVAAGWREIPYDSIEGTTQRLAALLARRDRPTGLVCCNDAGALAALRAAAACGLSVPGDLSVVGFDDESFAALVTPALTSVRVASDALGRTAVRLLLTQRATNRIAGGVVRLPPSLVVRASTGAPPA